MVYTADLKSAAFGIEGSSPSAHTIIISINISMQNFYKRFPEIDNVYWTNYFLNEFFPKYKIFEQLSMSNTSSLYTMYLKKDFYKDLEILKLSSLLVSKLNFPSIEYFSIFKHRYAQTIHADGKSTLRYASFNLPLVGFEGTKMCFYNTKPNVIPKVTDAYYFKEDDVCLATELEGKNEWTLVNSSIPHNIVNSDFNNPRITVCIRFNGNPKFEDLITTEG